MVVFVVLLVVILGIGLYLRSIIDEYIYLFVVFVGGYCFGCWFGCYYVGFCIEYD